jgi:hypothetical protein
MLILAIINYIIFILLPFPGLLRGMETLPGFVTLDLIGRGELGTVPDFVTLALISGDPSPGILVQLGQ